MGKETVSYREGVDEFEALLFSSSKEKKPTIFIFHAWDGRGEFTEKKAEEFAAKGYTGIAMDVFGKGKVGNSLEEKKALMEPLIKDRSLLLRRIKAGYEALTKHPTVSPDKIVAMGFCFGGLCALDLARSGAGLKGAISLHGNLSSPNLEKQPISAKLLILHGHNDPMVPPETVQEFMKEMTNQNADWQVHVYSNTLHAFTNPKANDIAMGTVYNRVADVRSSIAVDNFLKEILDN